MSSRKTDIGKKCEHGLSILDYDHAHDLAKKEEDKLRKNPKSWNPGFIAAFTEFVSTGNLTGLLQHFGKPTVPTGTLGSMLKHPIVNETIPAVFTGKILLAENGKIKIIRKLPRRREQGEATMKAPAKLKIGNQEFVREDLLKGSSKTQSMTFAATKLPALLSKPAKMRHKGVVVKAKVKIPRELWAPIYKKIGEDKKLISELKKLLKAGEPAALMEFARTNELDYDALRKIMSLVNPNLHTDEVLSGILSKAVKALKDAGVVSPLSISKGALWAAWTKAIDESAKA